MKFHLAGAILRNLFHAVRGNETVPSGDEFRTFVLVVKSCGLVLGREVRTKRSTYSAFDCTRNLVSFSL